MVKVGTLVRGKGFHAPQNLEWNGALAVVTKEPDADGRGAEIRRLHDGKTITLHRSSLTHWFETSEDTGGAQDGK